MRLVIARCQVDYVGRLTAHLPMAQRLLLIKADGSVSIHSDDRAYKPLNWMSPPCWLIEDPDIWVVQNKAGEKLIITLAEVLHDSKHELGPEPGLVKDGVEADLQKLLAEHVTTLGEGWTLVRREFPTPIGPVDLMCRDSAGKSVAVEIKRRGEIDGVDSSPATWSSSTATRCSPRCAACSRRSRSSPRPAPSPRTAASAAWSWTTTRCAASSPTSSACSDPFRAPRSAVHRSGAWQSVFRDIR